MKPKPLNQISEETTEKAIQILMEAHATFSIPEFLKTAQHLTVGFEVPQRYFIEALNQRIDSKALIFGGDGWLTTTDAKQKETALIRSAQAEPHWSILRGFEFMANFAIRYSFQDYKHRVIADRLLRDTAPVNIMVSRKRKTICEFYNHFTRLAKSLVHVHHIFPDKTRSKQFEAASDGLKAQNLYGFLAYTHELVARYQAGQSLGSYRHLWVIHHAEILSTSDAQTLVNNAKHLKAKIQLIHYDNEKTNRWRTGQASHFLQPYVPTLYLHGAKNTQLDRVLARQFNKLSERIIETKPTEIDQRCVSWFLEKAASHKIASVFVETDAKTEELNSLIRSQLKDKQHIEPSGLSLPILKPVFLREGFKQDARFFCEGEVIIFSRHLENKKFAKGEQWVIEALDLDKNKLILKKSGIQLTLSLTASKSPGLHVFSQKILEVCKGDRIDCHPPKFIEPDFELMPANKTHCRPSKLYIQGLENGDLKYAIVDHKGKLVEDRLTSAQLGLEKLFKPLKTVTELNRIKPKILEITTSRGHTALNHRFSATVLSVDPEKKSMVLQKDDQTILEVNLTHPGNVFWQYGFAKTMAQSRFAPGEALLQLPSNLAHTDAKDFTTTVKNLSHRVDIITNNTADLQKRLLELAGMRLNAIDLQHQDFQGEKEKLINPAEPIPPAVVPLEKARLPHEHLAEVAFKADRALKKQLEISSERDVAFNFKKAMAISRTLGISQMQMTESFQRLVDKNVIQEISIPYQFKPLKNLKSKAIDDYQLVVKKDLSEVTILQAGQLYIALGKQALSYHMLDPNHKPITGHLPYQTTELKHFDWKNGCDLQTPHFKQMLLTEVMRNGHTQDALPPEHFYVDVLPNGHVRYLISSPSGQDRYSGNIKKCFLKDLPSQDLNSIAFKEALLDFARNRKQAIGEFVYALESTMILEQTTSDLTQQGKQAVKPVLSKDSPQLKAVQADEKLTVGQRQAVIHILSTPDRFSGVHGAPGVGKTTLLKVVKRLGHEAGFDFIGITNTKKASLILSEQTRSHDLSDAGILCKTVARFIIDADRLIKQSKSEAQQWFEKKIILIDESSQISTKEMCLLQTQVNKMNARLVLIGDSKQLGSVNAGNPFKKFLTKDQGSFVRVNEIKRLKDPVIFHVASALYRGDIELAIELLVMDDRILEIPDQAQRNKAMATNFVNHLEAGGIAMMSLNEERKQFNIEVRKILKSEKGLLSGDELLTHVLVSKDMPQEAKTLALSYEHGDVVRFSNRLTRLGIQKEDYCRVQAVKNDIVYLENQAGHVVSWRPKEQYGQFTETYQVEERALAAGEKICWRRNDPRGWMINTESADVIRIDAKQHTVDIRLENGNLKTLSLMAEKEKLVSRLQRNDFVLIPSDDQDVQEMGRLKSVERKLHTNHLTLVTPSGKQHVLNVPQDATIKVLVPISQNAHWDYDYGKTACSAQGMSKTPAYVSLIGTPERNTLVQQLTRGQQIIMPDESQAKIGFFENFVHDKSGCQIRATTRSGKLSTFTVPATQDVNGFKNYFISAYPKMTEESAYQPGTTSEAFLVMLTRGDQVRFYTNNIDSLVASLKASKREITKTLLNLVQDGGTMLSIDTIKKLNAGQARGIFDYQKTLDEKIAYWTNLVQFESKVISLEGKGNQLKSLKPSVVDKIKQAVTETKSANTQQLNITQTKHDPTARSQAEWKLINHQIRSEINARLKTDVIGFVTQLCGQPPISKSGSRAKWITGRNVLTVETEGSKAGSWQDVTHGQQGQDLLNLYIHIKEVSWNKAIKELGGGNILKNTIHKVFKAEKQAPTEIAQQKAPVEEQPIKEAEKIKKAQAFHAQCNAFEKTAGEKYLREVCRFKGRIPSDFKFQSRCWHFQLKEHLPMLSIPIKNKNREIQGSIRTFLEPDGSGRKLDRGSSIESRLNLGKISQGTIYIQDGSDQSVCYISKCPESALSIQETNTQYDIRACHGAAQLQHIHLDPKTKTVVIVANNDVNYRQNKTALINAVEHYLKAGLEVKLALPLSHQAKNLDIHAVFKAQGAQGVEKVLEAAVKVGNVKILGDQHESIQTSFLRIQEAQRDLLSQKEIATNSSDKIQQYVNIEIER